MYLYTCPRCGRANTGNTRYCAVCGQDLIEPKEAPSLPDVAALAAQGFVYKGTILARYTGKAAFVKVPEGTTSIGPDAFRQNDVVGVSLPDSLTAIETNAFAQCSQLRTVQWGKGLTQIGKSAFSYTRLEILDIPDHVAVIDDVAFQYCANLKAVRIGKGLKKMSEGVFSGCNTLQTFEVATDNPFFCVRDGVLFDKKCQTLLCYPAGVDVKTYVLPQSVLRIANNAFYGAKITSVIFNASLISIGNCAFMGSALCTCTLPGSVQSVGAYAFSHSHLQSIALGAATLLATQQHSLADCPHLSSISVATTNPYYSVLNGILFSKDGRTLCRCPAADKHAVYRVPEMVTSIGPCAFNNCAHLTTVVLPDHLTNIGYAAFDKSGITSLCIPRGMQRISNPLGFGMPTLQWVYLPDTVQYIDAQLFYCNTINYYCQSPVQPVGWSKDWAHNTASEHIHWGSIPPKQ